MYVYMRAVIILMRVMRTIIWYLSYDYLASTVQNPYTGIVQFFLKLYKFI